MDAPQARRNLDGSGEQGSAARASFTLNVVVRKGINQ
jgi:hypothetical protein